MPRIQPIIVSFLTNIYIQLQNLKRFIGFDINRIPSVLILPPTDWGSLGDQAMVTAVINHFQEQGIKKISLLCYNSVSECQDFYPNADEIIKYRNSFQFVRIVNQYQKFCCLGADVMDGYYSEKRSLLRANLAALADRAGCDSYIFGFSFNRKPTPACARALEKLPPNVKLCARDPVSHKRLTEYIARDVELVADLAFLLHPTDDSPIASKVLTFISEQQAQNRIVVGINANCKLLDSFEVKTTDNLIKIYVDTLVEISKNGQFSFVLIPHDFREKKDAISDISFAEMILSSMPSEIKSYCTKVPIPCTAADIKSICGKLDIVLTGRMHLAIASLGQGTPAACITYQDKFEGLFKHFELEGMTIVPEQAIKPGKLYDFVMPLIRKQDEIRKHINLKLPQVQQLAKGNFT